MQTFSTPLMRRTPRFSVTLATPKHRAEQGYVLVWFNPHPRFIAELPRFGGQLAA